MRNNIICPNISNNIIYPSLFNLNYEDKENTFIWKA